MQNVQSSVDLSNRKPFRSKHLKSAARDNAYIRKRDWARPLSGQKIGSWTCPFVNLVYHRAVEKPKTKKKSVPRVSRSERLYEPERALYFSYAPPKGSRCKEGPQHDAIRVGKFQARERIKPSRSDPAGSEDYLALRTGSY